MSPTTCWLVDRRGTDEAGQAPALAAQTAGLVGHSATPIAPNPATLVIQRSTLSYPSYAPRKTPSAHRAPTKMLRMSV